MGMIWGQARIKAKDRLLLNILSKLLVFRLKLTEYTEYTTQKKPQPNNGQCVRPSRPVCGSEPADLGDLAGRPRRSSRPT
ncbi:hypothetical protein BpHYR1_042413 [Brachionus plicatilis]|uniref:Uncharacterized protein n=1 Tax=Brachionus plicatilis TaxID=10195 RepID=A0A3M7QIW6_BRAPC|nr:hypothetical protein BpHYR1_042413 [Brachionus plicatilis]